MKGGPRDIEEALRVKKASIQSHFARRLTLLELVILPVSPAAVESKMSSVGNPKLFIFFSAIRKNISINHEHQTKMH